MNFSLNWIGDKGIVNLAKYIVQYNALESLNLSMNIIKAEGAQILSQVLGKCNSLIHLDLGFNYLGNATYTSIRINILEPKCIGCHAASSPSAGYSLTSYSSVITRVVSGNGAGSTLYNRVNGGGMPPSGNPLNALEIKTIKDWIDLGAQNN